MQPHDTTVPFIPQPHIPGRRSLRVCNHCGIEFMAYHIYEGMGLFCSVSCSNTYKNKHVQKRPTADRFWAKVNKDGPVPDHVPDIGQCWVWLGSCWPNGYGRFGLNHSIVKAHRVGYELQIGPITDKLFVLHRCDNRACVRGSHLFLGTAADNNRDAIQKGRRPSKYTAPTKADTQQVVDVVEFLP